MKKNNNMKHAVELYKLYKLVKENERTVLTTNFSQFMIAYELSIKNHETFERIYKAYKQGLINFQQFDYLSDKNVKTNDICVNAMCNR